MPVRSPIIAVRPRKGSDLEAEQKARGNDMADIVHEWAGMFKDMARKSERETDK